MIETSVGAPARREASPVSTNSQRSSSWVWWLEEAMPGVVFLSWLVAVLRGYRSGYPWMHFLQDDVFYYLKIAQNIAQGHGSTFNGIVSTNGYHPLWLLVLTGLSYFTTQGWAIISFMAAAILLASICTFYLANMVLHQANMSRLLRRMLAAYVSIYALHIFYTGMEIVLAIPMMFLVIVLLGQMRSAQRGFAAAFLLGLAVSGMILSRLDLAIFTGLLALFALMNAEVRRTIGRKELGGLALGLIPFAVYLAFNHVHFGTWLPVSGMSKQTKFTHDFSIKPWYLIYIRRKFHRLNLFPVHVAILCLPFVWRRLQPIQKVVFPAVLLFPFLYFVTLSIVSDWQLWIWYMYPWRAGLCVAFVVLSLLPWSQRLLRGPVVPVLAALLLMVEVAKSDWRMDVEPGIHAAALDIVEFSKTHPGVYAMGDRSGTVGYLMDYPVVQTEGLVMDREFLEHVRRGDPLLPTLARYHVRYYVGTAWYPYKGCFHAEEPFQAGKTSRHMMADLCSAPLASWMHDEKRTLIFDLEKEGQR